MMQHALETIAILKDCMVSGRVDLTRLDKLQKTLAFAIDESKVNNRPADDLESLYESVLWLRCEVCYE